jgi:hypothetical protein
MVAEVPLGFYQKGLLYLHRSDDLYGGHHIDHNEQPRNKSAASTKLPSSQYHYICSIYGGSHGPDFDPKLSLY